MMNGYDDVSWIFYFQLEEQNSIAIGHHGELHMGWSQHSLFRVDIELSRFFEMNFVVPLWHLKL